MGSFTPKRNVSIIGLLVTSILLGAGSYFYLVMVWRPEFWMAMAALATTAILIVVLTAEFEKIRANFWECLFAGLMMGGFLTLRYFYPLPLALPMVFLAGWLGVRVALFYGILAWAFIIGASAQESWLALMMLLVTGVWVVRAQRLKTSLAYFATLFVLDVLFRYIALKGAKDVIILQQAGIDVGLTLIVFVFGVWMWTHLFQRTFFLGLLELLNPKHPLLLMLKRKAPGTYHHSLLVATIASYTAERLEGADPLLAQVGGQYHDVGKIFHAKSFAENQLGEDIVNTSRTKNHILAHVNAGLKMADRFKLPQAVKDIIATHHGDAVTTFYQNELKKGEEGKQIKLEDFRYPGPKPWTVEQILVMLADSAEAAVRAKAQKRMTGKQLEEVVADVIMQKMKNGQLDDCPLSGKELATVRKSFVEILAAINHARVDNDDLEKVVS